MRILNHTLPVTASFIILYFLATLIWWAAISARGLVDTLENFYFGVALGLLAVLGGVTGLTKSKRWGGYSSRVGKAIIFLSLGFITWGIGTLMIGYYNLALGQSYPYPSLADGAYILSWPLWFLGMFNLSRATGATYQLRNVKGKMAAVSIIVFAILISYYLLIHVARGGVFEPDASNYLRLFFDFAYPVGGVVILTSALLLFGLSFNYLGGLLKIPILVVILGFLLNYITDVIFTYTNTVETFYVASWVDLLYVITFFLLGLGVNLFDQRALLADKNPVV